MFAAVCCLGSSLCQPYTAVTLASASASGLSGDLGDEVLHRHGFKAREAHHRHEYCAKVAKENAEDLQRLESPHCLSSISSKSESLKKENSLSRRQLIWRDFKLPTRLPRLAVSFLPQQPEKLGVLANKALGWLCLAINSRRLE